MRASRCLEARIVFVSKLPSADTASRKSISRTFGLVARNFAELRHPPRKDKSPREPLASWAESPASTKACICPISLHLPDSNGIVWQFAKKQNAQAKACRI